jgi:hypothetical protein
VCTGNTTAPVPRSIQPSACAAKVAGWGVLRAIVGSSTREFAKAGYRPNAAGLSKFPSQKESPAPCGAGALRTAVQNG